MHHSIARVSQLRHSIGTHRAVLLMRFDRPGSFPTVDGAGGDGGAPRPRPEVPAMAVPESMRPKKVSPNFTPFPLPKYDAALGFGPVRLSDIPDVELAKQRQAAAPQISSPLQMGFLEMDEAEMASFAATSTQATALSAPADHRAVAAASSNDPLGGGYHVAEAHFPVMDRLECHRSVDDLLRQFRERPTREARTATVLDLASTLPKQTDGEMETMLYELGQLFDPSGNGLNFIVGRVAKFGRPYTVTSELTKAYVHLVDSLTDHLTVTRPDRLSRSPALTVQLVHFLALIKILEPNRWYSQNANAPQNRADYSHPSGINLRTAHHHTGESLVDALHALVAGEAPVTEGGTDTHTPSSFFSRCDDTQLVELLAGFAGLMPDGKPPGDVTSPVLNELTRRWGSGGARGGGPQPALLERLYLVLRLADISHDACLAPLLRVPLQDDAAASAAVLDFAGRRPLHVTEEAMKAPRGPDFFAAVARDKRPAVQRRAVEMLEESIAAASTGGDDELLHALVDSGVELLLSVKDKEAAASLAKRHQLNTRVLSRMPHMSTVAKRLAAEEASRTAAGERGLSHSTDYLAFFEGKRVHPIRTFVNDMDYIRQMDNVFLLHSSLVDTSVHQLTSAVRRLRTGKDTLLVTTRCLCALATAAQYAVTEKKRHLASRALEMVSYEVEKGRAILLTQEEEIVVHDAGTYCNEDLMLWTVAAYLARHVPLVKVHTLMSTDATARRPHHYLKGEHSPLTARGDLYNTSTPLLSALRSKELLSVTHHAPLERQVRDRRSSLYYVNPIRARFVYRRDKALFDKYHSTARNLAPGFSQGALASDLRGLGYYTPDHPQVPFTPLPASVRKNLQR